MLGVAGGVCIGETLHLREQRRKKSCENTQKIEYIDIDEQEEEWKQMERMRKGRPESWGRETTTSLIFVV